TWLLSFLGSGLGGVMRILGCFALCLLGATVGQAADERPAAKELEKLRGEWVFRSMEEGGEKFPREFVERYKVGVEGEKLTTLQDGRVQLVQTLKVDPAADPKRFTLEWEMGGARMKLTGIYELGERSWRLCLDGDGKEYPKEFKTAGKPSYRLQMLEK